MKRVLDRLQEQTRPFTTRWAIDAGATYVDLRSWVAMNLLRHPLRGVYHSPRLVDDLALRVDMLRLVVPPDCVVTDRTAGWLWDANMILAPNDHIVVPAVSVFAPPGRRLRTGIVASGERMLEPRDIAEIGGLRVTTPLRTACDLGRLLHRDQAFAAMDSLAGLGTFSVPELARELWRFKGYRGIIQARELAPDVDPASQSASESVLRRRWLDVGLPRPQCQLAVPNPWGGTWWLDMGIEEHRFAAEYDGGEFHTEVDREHDEFRRGWLHGSEGWTIVVVRQENLYGHDQDVDQLLREGARCAGLT